MAKSIFDLESRVDLEEKYSDLYRDMNTIKVNAKRYGSISVINLLDKVIIDWPYREACSSVGTYLYYKNIDLDRDDDSLPQTDKILYVLELYYNLLKWAIVHVEKNVSIFDSLGYDAGYISTINSILENIKYILEMTNYTIREKEDNNIFPQYVLSKRDASVDFAIECAPELSEVLLSYLDKRNENDWKYKKSLLIQVYEYMEPNRKKYNGISCSAISEEFFTAMNSLGIRHNGKSQKNIHYTKRVSVYDKLFKMALYIIQTEDVLAYKDQIKQERIS